MPSPAATAWPGLAHLTGRLASRHAGPARRRWTASLVAASLAAAKCNGHRCLIVTAGVSSCRAAARQVPRQHPWTSWPVVEQRGRRVCERVRVRVRVCVRVRVVVESRLGEGADDSRVDHTPTPLRGQASLALWHSGTQARRHAGTRLRRSDPGPPSRRTGHLGLRGRATWLAAARAGGMNPPLLSTAVREHPSARRTTRANLLLHMR
jgi:hypothetical protein